jgi:hypothetical protein
MIFNYYEIDRATIYLEKLFSRGKKVNIEPIAKVRTISQNNYCWLIFTHISQETGNTKEDIYQFCLQKFPLHKSIDINGVINIIPVTLSGMDKEQNSQFIDQIVIFFRQEGFAIPDPEDQKCLEMMNYYRERGLL